MRKIFSFNITRSTKTIIIAAALSLLASFPANSADIEDFQTSDYYGSGGLDLINAAEAYSKGYTGKDITLGINDDPVNLEHLSFSDKTGSKYIGSLSLNGIDWDKYEHGTHVGGIAAGSKNNSIMHGVAFDANLISTSNEYSDTADFFKYSQYPEIKVINNSWGTPNYLDYLSDQDEVSYSSDELFDIIVSKFREYNPELETMYEGMSESISDDKLLIFSAGNDGQTVSTIHLYTPLLFEGKTSKNIVNVTAVLNSSIYNSHLTKNSDKSFSSDFINAPFSNLAKYCEDNTIAAPGWKIQSSMASDINSYTEFNGTSMAAPFVTGSAALVQQAFPYMTSKQIGDVILSTANNKINLEHQFAVTLRDDSDEDDDEEKYSVNVFYFDDRIRSEDEIIDDINAYGANIANDLDEESQNYAEYFESLADQGKVSVFYKVPLQEFIGQGILDVGKAVDGPGALNARRLDVENLSDKYQTDKRSTIMYSIDTNGYDSVWNNDIKEIRVGKLANDSIEEDLKERYEYYDVNWLSNDEAEPWAKAVTKAYVEKYNQSVDEGGLEGLHVGLIKSGGGTLKLNGNNTYKGATVAAEGIIAINGSVAGDAYSDVCGTICGKGTINGTLYNNNAAVAGDNGEGNLTMNALESKGTLTAVANDEGNTKFIVNGKANVNGSTIKVQGLVPGESYKVLSAGSIEGELANGKGNSSPVSTFMSEYAKVENNEIIVVSEFSNKPNVINIPAGAADEVTFTKRQNMAFTAIRNMFFKLMSDLPEGAANYRASLRAVTSPQQINQIMTLINLPAAQAAPALSAVVNNAAAQSMTLVQRNSFVGDILSSHFADSFALTNGEDALKLSLEGENKRLATGGCCASERQDGKRVVEGDLTRENNGLCHKHRVNTNSVTPQSAKADSSPQVEPLGQHNPIAGGNSQVEALDNAAWFKFTYNKGEMRDGAKYRGRSGIIGYDLKLTDIKSFGLFFGHGNNTLDGFDDAWAKNKIEENRFGIYSSKKNDKYSGYLFLDYGKVDNELRRNLTNLDLSTNVKYKGDLFELGGEYKFSLKSQKNKTWKVNPYINLLFSKYKQDGYTENDGGIFSQVIESKTNNYAAGQLGLEFNFSNEKENYVLRLAGKRAFSGADPKLTFSFAGDLANKYELDNDQDKNHLLVSFKGERKISNNTLLSADFAMQRGSHDRDMKASLSFWKKF